MARSPEGNDGRRPSAADEHPFGSTTWEWRRVKMSRAPQASGDRRPKGGRWWFLPPWNPRKPLTITVRYRGGPECWFEVKSRGGFGRFPGHVALIDVMREVWQEGNPR